MDDERIAALFGTDIDSRMRAALLDALAEVPVSPAIEAVASEELEELDRIVVDISVGLPAAGSARYSVQLERDAGGNWLIVWFQGPGVEWPGRGPGRGEGLTTSAPPAGDDAP
jgi:hypothetical protein